MGSDTPRDTPATSDDGTPCDNNLPKCPDPAIKADLLRRHREGMSYRQCAVWLEQQHGIKVHHGTIGRYIERAKATRADMAGDPQPINPGPLAASDLGPAQPDDDLAQLKRDVMAEYRASQRDPDDWKRVQGALRLRLSLVAAKPAPPPEPPTPPGEQAEPKAAEAFQFN